MLFIIFAAAVLVGIAVTIHATGFAIVLSRLVKSHSQPPTQPWPIMLLLVRLVWLLILIHAFEISVWAIFYWWEGCLPDAESAFYFSGVTYTTIGYGDLVLSSPWRMLSPIQGVTGTLMGGLSAGLFFATVNRIYSPRLLEKKDQLPLSNT